MKLVGDKATKFAMIGFFLILWFSCILQIFQEMILQITEFGILTGKGTKNWTGILYGSWRNADFRGDAIIIKNSKKQEFYLRGWQENDFDELFLKLRNPIILPSAKI